jgi:DeoR family transcriptional regulator, fructose operon transcriptional repressor
MTSEPETRPQSLDMDARLAALRDQLVTSGAVRIMEMAVQLGVSPMTVRRDLVQLETAGIARRVRGGAVALVGPSFAERHQVHARAKARIAAKLAKMLPAQGSIALDSSSTILHLVRYLNESALTVVTNGVETHRELARASRARVILTGGELHAETGSLVGAVATRVSLAFSVRRFFMSAGGVDPSLGATERYLEEAEIKQAMAEHAAEVILAVDVSKLDAPELAQSVSWSQVAYLATELPPRSISRSYHNLVEIV